MARTLKLFTAVIIQHRSKLECFWLSVTFTLVYSSLKLHFNESICKYYITLKKLASNKRSSLLPYVKSLIVPAPKGNKNARTNNYNYEWSFKLQITILIYKLELLGALSLPSRPSFKSNSSSVCAWTNILKGKYTCAPIM